MKILLLLVLIMFNPLISQDNMVELPPEKIEKQRIMIANAYFGENAKQIDQSKLEAAVTLASALSDKYYLIPGTKLDSTAKVMRSLGEEPTALSVANRLNVQKILFFNVNMFQRILRVGVTATLSDSTNYQTEGEGWSAIRYLSKKDDKPMIDPALLTAVQRAFADMDNDSLMYDKAEGSFRVYPAEPLVIGPIDFIDDDDLPDWEIFDTKEVYSFDAIETIFEQTIKDPSLVTYDLDTRDSLYAMFGMHLVENFNAPSSLELEILTNMDVKYFITGNLKRVEGGAFLELFFCELYKNKLNILKSAEGILTEDSIEQMRKLIKKLTHKILHSEIDEK